MKTKMIMTRAAAVAAVAVATVAGSFQLSAADTKAAPAPKAAAPAVKSAPKTLAELFAFLPDTVAIIGNKKITKQDFLKRLGNIPAEYVAQLQPEMLKAQSKQMIETLVDAEILLDMVKKAGIVPSKKLVEDAIDQQLKSLTKEQRDMLEKQLAMQNKKIDDIKKDFLNNPDAINAFAIQSWIEKNVKPGIKVSDAEAKAFYHANENQYKMPERIDASHILISTMPDPNAKDKNAKMSDADAKAKAEKILAQLKQGADFAELAKKESKCPSGKDGGKLGEFPRGQMVPEFEKAAFALAKPGDISGVVKTQFGYHIIKLNKKTAAAAVPFEQVKAQIINQLQSQKLQAQVKAQVDAAKKNVKISYPAFK
ncbi:MAG: peptidylprolyl isomerase [Lentisphaeria bacterium]|nr:peptidylprolyl isomerase [Lentisphaeria bacterium]